MSWGIREEANKRSELIAEAIAEIEKRLKDFPDGSINIKKHKGHWCFYTYDNESGEKYLCHSDERLIEELVQKGYLKKVLQAFKKEQSVLNRTVRAYPAIVGEEVFEQLSEARKKFAKPIVTGDGEYVRKWLEKPYKPKPIANDVPVYLTMKGERVRSKSEMIIADRLYLNGIPYKYECPLMVGNGEIIHPDFSILKMSTRKVVYHEHCGRMDDPGYVDDMVSRVNKYNQAGITQGDSLFFSFETSSTPLDVRVIDELINKYFR